MFVTLVLLCSHSAGRRSPQRNKSNNRRDESTKRSRRQHPSYRTISLRPCFATLLICCCFVAFTERERAGVYENCWHVRNVGKGLLPPDCRASPSSHSCSIAELFIVVLLQPPDPSTVRPQPVLQLAVDALKVKWKAGCTYRYVCDQLKAIRQDLTVSSVSWPTFSAGARELALFRLYRSNRSETSSRRRCMSCMLVSHWNGWVWVAGF
jgi:hypothetical protein